MRALDTNILIRILTTDEPDVRARVSKWLTQEEENGEKFLVVAPVLLEIVWVLSSRYGFNRSQLLDAIETVYDMEALTFEADDVITHWIDLGRKTNQDLPDLLIGLVAKRQGVEYTLTLDKKAAKNSLFRMMR